MTEMKDTNPKDAIGVRKWRQYFVVPAQVIWEVGVGMLEGALKYGRHNYRASGVRASVYVDAAKGHIDAWVEGQDLDPDTGLSHITKAICSLVVLRDAEMNDFLVDDRPPRVAVERHAERLQRIVDSMFERHADKSPHHYSQALDGAPYYDPVVDPRQEALDRENEGLRAAIMRAEGKGGFILDTPAERVRAARRDELAEAMVQGQAMRPLCGMSSPALNLLEGWYIEEIGPLGASGVYRATKLRQWAKANGWLD